MTHQPPSYLPTYLPTYPPTAHQGPQPKPKQATLPSAQRLTNRPYHCAHYAAQQNTEPLALAASDGADGGPDAKADHAGPEQATYVPTQQAA